MTIMISSSLAVPVRQNGSGTANTDTAAYSVSGVKSNAQTDGAQRAEKAFDISKFAYLKQSEAADDETGLPKQDPEVARYSREKNMARETLERLVKELKMVKKVWANKPEELAEQLLRLGAELAKVAKQYQKAQKALAKILGDQSGISGALNIPNISLPAGVPNAEPSAAVEADHAEQEATEAEFNAEQAEDMAETASSEAEGYADNASAAGVPDAKEAPSEMKAGIAAYEKVQFEKVRLDETPFAFELRGDIEFAGRLRVYASELRKSLEEVSKKAHNLPGASKERDEFLKDAGKALKDLETEMFKYEGALKRAMPPAISVMQPVSA